jgi:hypothetical protein
MKFRDSRNDLNFLGTKANLHNKSIDEARFSVPENIEGKRSSFMMQMQELPKGLQQKNL